MKKQYLAIYFKKGDVNTRYHTPIDVEIGNTSIESMTNIFDAIIEAHNKIHRMNSILFYDAEIQIQILTPIN
jgi:hypothetical protein